MARTLQAFAMGAVLAVVSCAWANQVVLSPLSAGQYSDLQNVPMFNTISLPAPASQSALTIQSIPHSAPDPLAAYVYSGTLEFSLASLPANAVVTSATFTFQSAQEFVSSFALSIHDGVDGTATSNDIFKSPSAPEAIQPVNGPLVYTTPFADLTYLNDRAAKLPSGFLGLNITQNTFGGQGALWIGQPAAGANLQLPLLTIDYTVVPEPASLMVLGAGAVGLLRRRR